MYRGIAKRGSVLFFAMSTMNLIEPMYLWSLEFFILLYRRIIKGVESDD
jgi:hypothetical protein